MPKKIENMLDTVICGDCLKVMPQVPNDSIDLIITSPPYNEMVKYDIYQDNKKHDEYIEWLVSIFKMIYRKLKTGGRVAIVVGNRKNGAIQTQSDVIQFMTKRLRYIPMTTIIWYKANISNRTAWGSFRSPSHPSFPTPFEYILVFAKETPKLQWKGKTDLTRQQFVDWSYALWKLPIQEYADSGRHIHSKHHPAPFPEMLATRLIKMLSWKNSIVLDPFAGIGTTALACKKTGRHYLCIELSSQYCKLAEKRLTNVIVTDPLFEEEDDEGSIQDIHYSLI